MIKNLALPILLFILLIIPMGVLAESMGSDSYNTSGAVTGGGGNTTSTNFLTFLYNLLTGGNATSSSYQTTVGQFYETGAGGDEINCNPPEGSGNWDIDGHVKCVSRTIDIDGDINILAGDHLELDNVTLMINQTSSEDVVTINNGGILTAYNYSTLKDDEGTQVIIFRVGQNAYSVMNLSHTYVGRNLYVYVYNATLYLTDDSWIDYRMQLYHSAAKAVIEGSVIDQAFIYTYSNVTMRDFRTNVNHTSSTTSEDGSFAYNVTDSVTGATYLRTCSSGGSHGVTIDNSTMTQLMHYSTAGCDLNFTDSTAATFIIQAESSGGSLALSDIPDIVSGWTATYSNANGGDMFITDGAASYINLYSNSPCTVDNCTFDTYSITNTDGDYVKDTTVKSTYYAYPGGKTTFENTLLESSSRSMLYTGTVLNFTQPATNSRIENLYIMSGGIRTMYGFVNISSYSSSDTWSSGEYIIRYFPINVTTSAEAPVPDGNVSIWQGGTLLNYSMTGSDGMITTMNITDDDNTTVYELYLEDVWKRNITMLEPTAPYGIQLTEEAPTASDVVLSATTADNYTTDNLTATFVTSDTEGRTVYNITDWRLGGTSIAVLNMPFDTRTSSLATGAVKDYSTYGNDGTLGEGTSDNAPTWTGSGQVGGAYEFDGSNDYIEIPDSVRPMSVFTLIVWANIDSTQTYNYPGLFGGIGFGAANTKGGIALSYYDTTGMIFCDIYNATNRYAALSAGVPNDEWEMYTCLYNGTDVMLFFNTTKVHSTHVSSTGSITLDWTGSSGTAIGKEYQPSESPNVLNGEIDQVLLFNRSLSEEQIAAMYQAGLDGHHPELLVSDETTKGETWTVEVTPSDSYADGDAVTSNGLTIENTPPGQVTLSAPEDGNTTTNRTPQFSWDELSDPDADTLTYYLNLTCGYLTGGTDCSDDNREYAVGDGNCTGDGFCNYTIPKNLKYFGDDNYYYNWTVRAYDDEDYGAWAALRNVTIYTDVVLTLYNDTVQFGLIALGFSNDTTDDSPEPFRVRNDGNCFLDVNISSTDLLWDTYEDTASQYFQYEVDNVTGEENSLNWSSQNTTSSWAPVPVVNGSAISFLNYSDATDEAEIELYIEVPTGETAGVKTSTIWFTAGYRSEYE